MHTKYGGKLNCGGCRTGSGTWWPDFGPSVRDFSPSGKMHPTEHVFAHEVLPFSAAQRAQSEGALPRPEKPAPPQQFRHPCPATEALWKSVDVMPYKTAGRRKCGEASNWRAALSTGREGYRHGGRTPIWCKGPLLDNPDFHQLHPLKRHEDPVNLSTACVKEKAAAGTCTGTCPVDALVRSNHLQPKDMGMKDSATLIAEKTSATHKDASHSMTFKSANDRLTGKVESFTQSFRVSPASQGANRSVSFSDSVTSVGSAKAEDKLPNWIAPRTIATRDPGAAGGQSGIASIKRVPQVRVVEQTGTNSIRF